ncbi:MAG: hypothetical protein GX559_03275 [Candidatus Pacebacteria bacterium]|nr:hypothetical protein [Candidatus Paceibacterota bacterium]
MSKLAHLVFKIKPFLLIIFILLLLLILSYVYKDLFYVVLAALIIIFLLLKKVLSQAKFLKSKKKIKEKKPKAKSTDINFEKTFKLSKRLIKKPKKIVFFLVGLLVCLLVYLLIFVFKVGDIGDFSFFSDTLNNVISIFQNLYLIASFGLIFLVFLIYFIKQKSSVISKFIHFIIYLFIAVFIAFFLVFTLTFFYKNYLLWRMPSSNSIIIDSDLINEELRKMDKPPTVLVSFEDLGSEIHHAYLASQVAFGNSYFKNLVSISPTFIETDTTFAEAKAVLIENQLIFPKIDKDTIEKLSPNLGKLYVQSYLEDKYVKELPTVTVLGRQDYLSYRADMINDQVLELEEISAKLQSELNGVYGMINEAERAISQNEYYIQEATLRRTSDYDYCMTAGYYSYYLEVFYRTYSDSTCESEWNQWSAIIQEYYDNIDSLNQTIAWARQEAAFYKETLQEFDAYISLIESQKEATVYELGLFEPGENIKIALDNTGANSLADYLSTLVHEYFHYTSYVSDEKVLPLFFEEGLTEYFARKSIEQELKISTELGYPVIVTIINKMVDDIGLDKLQNIYLTKSKDVLIAELNQAYGDTFYEDTEYFFMLMLYLGIEDQLGIANNILFRIGGDQLNLEDYKI